MNYDEVIKLLLNGENERVEFKSNFNTGVIETLVAFSNTHGGKIVIGVSDSSEIVGVTINTESIQNWINEIKNKTSPSLIPDVDIIKENSKIVIVLSIQEYPIKPVSTRSRYIKRIANSNHLMSIDEIANEHLRTINTSWDFYLDPNHDIDNISLDKIGDFIRKVASRNQTTINISPIDFLSKLEIIRDNKLTFGAYLLFVKDYCLISDIQVGRFKSETKIIDSVSINSDLFCEIEEVIAFIKKHLMVEYIITGDPQRIERFDYPLDAIREIVVNMVVHRDYRDSNGSIIKIYDDRMEFYNPGKLYGGITVEDLLSDNYSSQTRNKLIAKAFKEVGIIEKYGTGIKRILQICVNHGIKQPKFEEKYNGFNVTLYKEKLNESRDRGVNGGVNGGVNEILEYIKLHAPVKSHQLSNDLKISQRTVERNLKELKNNHLIEFRGAPKTGGYYLVNEFN